LGENECCERARSILRNNFLKIDAVGVMRVTKFLLGEDVEDENLQAEVVGFVNGFIEICGRKK
jgi:hypothetical protein